MDGDADIAAIGALVADPARARILLALGDGRALPADRMPVSLVLPMGRFGPAFLAYNNFQVYLKWNQSLMYALTAAGFLMFTAFGFVFPFLPLFGAYLPFGIKERARSAR